MATGTLARLVVAVGIDDSQMVSGIARTRANVLSNLAQMGAQAETQVERTSANITRSNTGTIAAMAKPALVGLTTLVAIGAGLGMLAVKFESETSHIAAAANISSQAATNIGKDFINAAGKSQTMIFTAEDMTNSYAAVAGQLALTDSKLHVITGDMTFMKAATDLAAGSNEKLGDATSGIASILQNFGLKISDSTMAANALFDASRGLHLSIPQVTDVFEKLQGRLGTAGPGLQTTGILLEDMAQHSLTGQRNINLFAGAINTFLASAASPKQAAAASDALKTAELNLTAAQLKYNQAVATGAPGNAAHQLALERLTIAEEKLAVDRASYPAMSRQVVEAELAVQSAQVAATNSSVSGSYKVQLAAIALQKAHDAVAKAMLVQNGMTGNANALLKTLGVTVYDTSGKMLPMSNIIGQLHDAFVKMQGGATDWESAQKRTAAATLFGANAAGAMLGIIQGGAGAWDKYAANVKKGETAHEGAIKATQNLAAEWSLVVAQIQGYATTLSITLEPFITSLLQGLLKALPTIENDFTTAFHAVAGAVSFAWGIVGPILGFFGSHMQLVEAILAIFVARWLVIKGLKVAETFAGWGEGLLKLVSPTGPLRSLESLLDIAKSGSIGKGLQDTKNAWSDTFSTGQLVKAQNLGKAVEDSSKQIEGMARQLNASVLAQQIAPSESGAMLVQGWKDAITSARGDLVAKITNFVSDPSIQNALTGDLEKGITNPRVLTALEGILSTAENALGGGAAVAFRTAVQDALAQGKITSAVADSLTNASAQWEKGLTTQLSTAIKDGAKAAKVGDTVVNDIATAAKGAGGLGGILGGLKDIGGNIASRVVPFIAQPVTVVSFGAEATATLLAAGSGSGVGGIANLLGKGAGALAGGGLAAEMGVALAGLSTAALVTVVGSVVVGLGLGWLMVEANKHAKVIPGAAYGGGKQGLTASNIFADLQAGEAYSGSNVPRLAALAGLQYQDIVTQLEKRGLSEKQAAADAAIIEAAYKKGSITTASALGTLLNNIINGANGVKAAIAALSNKIYAIANGITVNRTTSGFIPGLQGGGDVTRGHLYIVGEHGPELFASNEAGSIIPFNHIAKTQSAMAARNIPSADINGFGPMGAATAVRQAPVIGTMIVNNPIPETASQSVEQKLRQVSYLGQM